MTIPKTVLQFALRHQINLGRGARGEFFVRDPATLEITDTTRSANPTVKNALALCRRELRRRAEAVS